MMKLNKLSIVVSRDKLQNKQNILAADNEGQTTAFSQFQ